MSIKTISHALFRRRGHQSLVPASTPVCAFALMVLALCCNSLFAAETLTGGPPPPLRLTFQSLGIQLLDGSTGLGKVSPTTVNFVDDHHILVTYAVRRLMKRLPDEPEDDEDNSIAAALIDLDTLQVLARHEWRVHDYQRFLWPLGHGRFLLRQHTHLTTIAPLAHLASGEPFQETAFLRFDRRIAAILLSPESDLLTVETAPQPEPKPKPKKQSPMAAFNAALGPPSNASPGPEPEPSPSAALLRRPEESKIQISFLRINYPANGADPIVSIAGRALSNFPVVVPLNAYGYLSVIRQDKRTAWATDFNAYSGKVYELPLYDSTCQPSATMISRSELIAFGCRGRDRQRYFAAFNLLGEEMWQKGFYDPAPMPILGFAPGTGRFAVNRLIVATANPDEDLAQLAHEHASAQTVDVYQINSGRQLIHITCTPVEPASENFSLSPDGMDLAVVNNGAIEIYDLPAPTPKELAANEKVLAAAPQEADANVPIQLGAPRTAAPETAIESASPVPAPPPPAPEPPPVAATTALPVQPTSADESAKTLGDAAPEAPRKRPTLYNQPGDAPAASPAAQDTPHQ